MNCLSATVKYILYVLNVIFLIGGLLLIIVGSIILSDLGNFSSFDEAVQTQTLPILAIVLGCIIFVVSFFGCCGTIRENSCCTSIYAIFMFILFVLQLAMSIWIFVKRDDFLKTVESIASSAWEESQNGDKYPMQALELAFNCCGYNGPIDYQNSTAPASCCGYTNNSEVCTDLVYNTRPACKTTFVDFWASNMDIISWSGIAIAIFELIIFMIASCLARQMRSR